MQLFHIPDVFVVESIVTGTNIRIFLHIRNHVIRGLFMANATQSEL